MKIETLAVGVTGGIGSGKSEVCRIFESFGSRVLSADSMAKELTDTHPTVKDRIRRQFGENLYSSDGVLNRKQLAKLVFQDESLLEKLNAIVHPFVIESIKTGITKAKDNGTEKLLFVEAALIFEAGVDEYLDYVIVVDAPEKNRIERVMARDDVSQTDVLERMKNQMPVKEKLGLADFIIENNGSIEQLQLNCKFVHSILQRMSPIPPEDSPDHAD